jgi:hypothetical protein
MLAATHALIYYCGHIKPRHYAIMQALTAFIELGMHGSTMGLWRSIRNNRYCFGAKKYFMHMVKIIAFC